MKPKGNSVSYDEVKLDLPTLIDRFVLRQCIPEVVDPLLLRSPQWCRDHGEGEGEGASSPRALRTPRRNSMVARRVYSERVKTREHGAYVASRWGGREDEAGRARGHIDMDGTATGDCAGLN